MTRTGGTRSAASREAASLEVYLLGTVDFDSALFLQERFVYDVSGREDAQGILMLCEHPPIVTVGREGSRRHFRTEPSHFAARGIDVRWLSRGGGTLMHAPGQLAAYVILPLERLEIGLDEYCRRLEQSVIDSAAELHVPAFRRPELSGVWCRCGQFAQVGAAVKRWVTCHGVFLNVAPPLGLLRMVDPTGCGERVTSLAAQRVRNTSMHAAREHIIRHLAGQFGYERVHVYTGHPLLTRTTRTVHAYA